jgi:hypothetical protein
MASKKLKDLAKIGLGLAAAYGASKVLGNKTMGGSDTAFGIDASMDTSSRSSGPVNIQPEKTAVVPMRDTFGSSTAQEITQSRPIDDFGSSMASTDKGSVDAFRKSELDRMARIESLRGNKMSDRKMALSAFDEKARAYNRSMTGAKKGKMIKASKGGSVVARGNKLARSKPTKLF